MKKILSVIICITICVSLLQGCGKTNNSDVGNKDIVAVEEDSFRIYISGLSQESKAAFPRFWINIVNFCKNAEYKLEKVGNEKRYEFDPTDFENIPEEVKNVINCEEIKVYSGYKMHNDYKMIIEGNKVNLSFDKQIIYPTSYSYSDIVNFASDEE